MSITPFAAGLIASNRQTATILAQKSQLDTLTTQLATGRTADTYGGLGSGRTTSLSAHAAISALDGYSAAIGHGTTRVAVASAGIQQVATAANTVGTALTSGLASGSAVLPKGTQQIAANSLSAAVDALNQQSGDLYVFSGRSTDTQPVVSLDAILNGDPSSGLAGVRTLIAEQKTADLGPGGNGRLTQTASGATLSLTEDPSAEARANFGFTLQAATSSNAGAIAVSRTAGTAATVTPDFATIPMDGQRVRVAVTQADGSQKTVDLTARATGPAGANEFLIGTTTAASGQNLRAAVAPLAIAGVQSAGAPGASATFTGGSAAAVSLSVAGTPVAGDTITVTLGLHDGTTTTITLTAAATADATSKTSFAIGATPAATAANLSTALSNALTGAASTTLAASSATRASQNFFDGSTTPGLAPRRVDAAGTGYAQTVQGNTVIWYRGDDTSADPRATATVQAGANRSVAVGVQANEGALRATLAGLAAIAGDSFSDPATATDVSRFKALSQRSATLLTTAKDGVTGIATDLSLASSSLSDAKSLAQSSKATLQDSLDGVETVSTEAVATKLLNLQTQLQATYQVTSMLSKLSLVNYIS